MKRFLSTLLAVAIGVAALVVSPLPAWAFVAQTGTFTAEASCPATVSIRQPNNPGGVTTEVGMAYPLLGKNKQAATHYRIRIAGASPTDRWVPIACGRIDSGIISGPQDYVLAASWQPSFCETRPSKPECESQTGDRFDATHFAIHGLWPQPRSNIYCEVPQNLERLDRNKRWLELPPLVLSPALRQDLAVKMPGYQSGLHRHEWYKHGTCYSDTPEEYYQETIALLDQLNASTVRQLLVRNLERDLTGEQIRQAFGTAFGAENKVLISCATVNREDLIQELLISLRGEIEADTPLTELLANAPDASPGCPIGQVDSVDERPFVEEPPAEDAPRVEILRLPDGRIQIRFSPDQLPITE